MPDLPPPINFDTERMTAERASKLSIPLQLETLYKAAQVNYKLGLEVSETEPTTNRPISGFEVAERCYTACLILDPNFLPALHDLSCLGLICGGRHGTTYEDKQSVATTVLGFVDRALVIQPNSEVVLNNKGVALIMLGRYEEAVTILTQALTIKPDYTDAMCDLGSAYESLGDYPKAIEWYKKAVAIPDPRPESLFNLSRLLIWSGDYIEGWKMYECRWKWDAFTSVHLKFNHTPRWMGERIDGKTIVLYAEQGMGDTIQFVRYASLIKERYGAGKVVLLVPVNVASLIFISLRSHREIVVEYDISKIGKFDIQCPLMSLPFCFGTTTDTIPLYTGYLDGGLQEMIWYDHLGRDCMKFRVGLCWAGSKGHGQDKQRSVNLDILSPLKEVDGVVWHSFQKGQLMPTPEQLLEWKMLDYSEQFTSLHETAGLLSQMDLVITVDTSIAHLAGAMGKHVWLLLPYASEFRWGSGSTTPWYKSMYIFRQTKRDQWGSVVTQVVENLKGLVRSYGQ